MNMRTVRSLVGLALLVAISGCASVPGPQLDAYKKNFATVKTTATDLYLQTEIYAEELAADPRTGKSIAERLSDLDKRKAAIKTRLDALDLIGQYNDAITALAAGADPDAIATNLKDISSGLKTLKIDELTRALGGVAPYAGVIAKAVGLIDDAIDARRFKEAVYAAYEPITGIIGILEKDATTIQTKIIQPRLLEAWNNPHRARIDALRFEFEAVAKGFSNVRPAGATSAVPTVDQLYAKMNEAREKLTPWPKTLALTPLKRGAPGPHNPSAAELVSLGSLVSEVDNEVAAANRILAQYKAQVAYIAAYQKALSETSAAFQALKANIEKNRVTSITILASEALQLRKAYLQIRSEQSR